MGSYQTQGSMDLNDSGYGSSPSLASMVGQTNGFPPMANHSVQGGSTMTVSGGLGIANGHGQFAYTAAVETQVELDGNGIAEEKCVKQPLRAEDHGQTKFANSSQNQNYYSSQPKGSVQITVNRNGEKQGYGGHPMTCGGMSYDRSFQIFVEGFNNKTYTIDVKASDQVQTLMKKINERMGMAPSQQRLTYAGRQLKELETLGSYGIHENSTVNLHGRLRGGKACGE